MKLSNFEKLSLVRASLSWVSWDHPEAGPAVHRRHAPAIIGPHDIREDFPIITNILPSNILQCCYYYVIV